MGFINKVAQCQVRSSWLFFSWTAPLQGSQSLTSYGSSWSWQPGPLGPAAVLHVFSSEPTLDDREDKLMLVWGLMNGREWLRLLGGWWGFSPYSSWITLAEVLFFQVLSPLSFQFPPPCSTSLCLGCRESWMFQINVSEVMIKTGILSPLS